MSDRKDVQSNIRIFRSFAQLLALSFELSKQSDDDKSEDEYEKQQNAIPYLTGENIRAEL